MRKLIHLNITQNEPALLKQLLDSLQKLAQDKIFGTFLVQELACRTNAVLFNEELSAEHKIGALQQINEIKDLLFSSDAQNEIKKLIQSKSSKEPDPEAALKEQKKLQDYKDKVFNTK